MDNTVGLLLGFSSLVWTGGFSVGALQSAPSASAPTRLSAPPARGGHPPRTKKHRRRLSTPHAALHDYKQIITFIYSLELLENDGVLFFSFLFQLLEPWPQIVHHQCPGGPPGSTGTRTAGCCLGGGMTRGLKRFSVWRSSSSSDDASTTSAAVAVGNCSSALNGHALLPFRCPTAPGRF